MLTENTVRASDRRALFVSLEAYEQAGGPILRDLFEADDGGWLQDVPLLDRLVIEKLGTEAGVIAAEGWKGISVAVDFPHGHDSGLLAIDGTPADLTVERETTKTSGRGRLRTASSSNCQRIGRSRFVIRWPNIRRSRSRRCCTTSCWRPSTGLRHQAVAFGSPSTLRHSRPKPRD